MARRKAPWTPLSVTQLRLLHHRPLIGTRWTEEGMVYFRFLFYIYIERLYIFSRTASMTPVPLRREADLFSNSVKHYSI